VLEQPRHRAASGFQAFAVAHNHALAPPASLAHDLGTGEVGRQQILGRTDPGAVAGNQTAFDPDLERPPLEDPCDVAIRQWSFALRHEVEPNAKLTRVDP
jgi:hypothetical protein